jgi:hypothetical protein
MANLGSEVSRAILEYEKQDFEKMYNSIIRSKGIIEKIEEFPEMKGRTGEIEILKLIIEDLNNKKFELKKDQLLNYFTPFAIKLMSV